MRRWIGSLKPSNRKPEPVEPPAPPMAGPSGQPAGIDHLMANARQADEIGEVETVDDGYASLMPVRRLSDQTTALLAPPSAPDTLVSEAASAEIPPPATLASEASGGAQSSEDPDADRPAPVETRAAPASSEPAPEAEPPPMKAPHATWQTLHALARMGSNQRDFEAALGWWRLMRLGFPSIFHGYADAALALMELGRFDQGRELLTAAAPLFPNEPGIPASRAMLEDRAGNGTAAIEAWRAAMNFPASPWWACLRLAETLEKHGTADEVDAVLRDGCRDARFRAPAVCLKAIRFALRRQDWPALAERLGCLEVCGDAEILGLDFDAMLVPLRDADPASFETVMRAPWVDRVIGAVQTDPNGLIQQARLAQLAGRLSDTMSRLATLRPIMPQTADAYLRVEAILREAGYADVADGMLDEAAGRLPDEEDIQMRVGAVKEARGDWAAAVTHWAGMAQRFPDSATAADRLSAARAHLPELKDAPA